MPERALDEIGLEESAHELERPVRLRLGLGREAVHEIRMHHDAGAMKRAERLSRRTERDTLRHQLEEPVVRAFESAGHRNAARL